MTNLTKHEKVRVEAIVHYANEKALEVTRDMLRGGERLRIFSKAWVRAAREYIDSAEGDFHHA